MIRTIRRSTTLALAALSLAAAVTAGRADAAEPGPIAASSVQVIGKKHAVKAWELLPLTTIASYLSIVAGRPIVISCDEPGVDGADGRTLEPGNDGNVFWNGSGYGPMIHVSVAECLGAQRATRQRAVAPIAWVEYHDQRMDEISAPALQVMLHEAMHISLQSDDEGLVECAATRNAWALVKQFHLPAWEARMVLAGMAWRHEVFPAAYHTAC